MFLGVLFSFSYRAQSLYLQHKNTSAISCQSRCAKGAVCIQPRCRVSPGSSGVAPWNKAGSAGCDQLQGSAQENERNCEGGKACESSLNDGVVQTLELRLQNWQEKGNRRKCCSRKEEIFPKLAVCSQLSFHRSVTPSAERRHLARLHWVNRILQAMPRRLGVADNWVFLGFCMKAPLDPLTKWDSLMAHEGFRTS